ncbi:DUF3800 domain-containing protein [Phreatobacter aquaticus]|uniref:DUF3800 domain-containing protein n=1 Tax=Phreatobacter aquaticus TaxID=2570229 RepID=A0A4D7QPD8_9HYPH|nr:DUF3800 domain-containing protein [Phreatobacter aquaticus]QCK87446.1 DUF3800 domain-containing protein [Phreatobacter aquaticus]
MHILFTDESGTPPKRNAVKGPRYFTIAGVAIPIELWRQVNDAFCALKDDPRYQIVGEVKWKHFGERRPGVTNNVTHLSMDERISFRRELFDIITKRERIKIISCVCSAAAAYETSYIKDENDLYEYTYKPVSERFQYYLQDISTPEHIQYGLIVCDHRDRHQDDRLRRRHQSFVNSTYKNFSNYNNLVEGLFLTQSDKSVGVQLADMVAGAIGRYFNSDDKHFALQLKPSFRSGPGKKVLGYGIVKFPKAGWR